jgi:hypothetical protein
MAMQGAGPAAQIYNSAAARKPFADSADELPEWQWLELYDSRRYRYALPHPCGR